MKPENDVLKELHTFFVEHYLLQYTVKKEDLIEKGWSFDYKDAPDKIPDELNIEFDQLPDGDITGRIKNPRNKNVITEKLATDLDSNYEALVDVLDVIY